MSPRVSIITPVYNARKYLPQTWKSIKAQTFTDWEWVVWEDGSDDGTAQWLLALAARDSRVRVYTGERTKSAGAGRNRAARQARGEFLAFLDADDLWHPQKLHRQVALFDADPATGATYTHMKEFWSPESDPGTPPPRTWPRHELGANPLAAILTHGNPASPSTLMVRRAVFEAVGEFSEDLRGLEDFEYAARTATRHPIRRAGGTLAKYRLHGNNMSHGMSGDFSTHQLLLTRLRERGLLDGPGGAAYRAVYHTRRAEYAMEGKLDTDPRRDILASIRWNPRRVAAWIPLLLLPLPRAWMLPVYTWLKRVQARLFAGRVTAHRMAGSWKADAGSK